MTVYEFLAHSRRQRIIDTMIEGMYRAWFDAVERQVKK